MPNELESKPAVMNPFNRDSDPDRHVIWERLVIADCEAFSRSDWSIVDKDFDAESFEGLRCFHSGKPDDWRIVFPTVASYRDSWLAASVAFRARHFANMLHLDALLYRTHLDEIEINGNRALAHKKFYGDVDMADGSVLSDRRQTLYRLQKRGDSWKIVGFLGQLPLYAE
jgi:hypothetical protein